MSLNFISYMQTSFIFSTPYKNKHILDSKTQHRYPAGIKKHCLVFIAFIYFLLMTSNIGFLVVGVT